MQKALTETGPDPFMPSVCIHCNLLRSHYLSWGQGFQGSFMYVPRTIYNIQTLLFSQHRNFNRHLSMVLIQMHH